MFDIPRHITVDVRIDPDTLKVLKEIVELGSITAQERQAIEKATADGQRVVDKLKAVAGRTT